MYHHHADCLTTGPQSLPKRVLHRVRSHASSSRSINFSFPYYHPVGAHVFFLVFLSLLSCLLSFPSFACFRRQFLPKMWPVHLASLLFDVGRTCGTCENNIVHNLLACIAVLWLLATIDGCNTTYVLWLLATIDTCNTTYVCTYNN
jgi:hypothetical protein